MQSGIIDGSSSREAEQGFMQRFSTLVRPIAPNIIGVVMASTATFALNPGGGLQSDSDMLTDGTSVIKCLAFVGLLLWLILRDNRRSSSEPRISLRMGYVILAAEFALLLLVSANSVLLEANSTMFAVLCTAASIVGTCSTFFWLASVRGISAAAALAFVFVGRGARELLDLIMALTPFSDYTVGAIALVVQLACLRRISKRGNESADKGNNSTVRIGSGEDELTESTSNASDGAVPEKQYFSGFDNDLSNRRFLASFVLCFGMISAANGLLRGFPDGSSIFFTLPTMLGSSAIVFATCTIGLYLALRKPLLSVMGAVWAILLCAGCAALLSFAIWPGQREFGAMFATAFNDVMQMCRWYISIALMSASWRNPYYHITTTYLVFLLPRAIARTATVSAACVCTLDPLFMAALTATILMLSQLFLTSRITVIATDKRKPEEVAADSHLMDRILGLNEAPATAAQTHLEAMTSSAQEIGTRFALSEREVEVLALFAAGHTKKRVAEELFISPSTVHAHITHIYAKTGFHSRQEILDYIDAEL